MLRAHGELSPAKTKVTVPYGHRKVTTWSPCGSNLVEFDRMMRAIAVRSLQHL